MVTSPLIYIIALIIIYELTVTIYNNNSSSNLPAKNVLANRFYS